MLDKILLGIKIVAGLLSIALYVTFMITAIRYFLQHI